MTVAVACLAHDADTRRRHRFVVRGATESLDLPLRVLEVFAQRRLSPTSVHVRRRGEAVAMRIALVGLCAREAEILGARIGAIVGVTSLDVS